MVTPLPADVPVQPAPLALPAGGLEGEPLDDTPAWGTVPTLDKNPWASPSDPGTVPSLFPSPLPYLPTTTAQPVPATIDDLPGGTGEFATTGVANSQWIFLVGFAVLLVAAWLALLFFASRRGWQNFATRYRVRQRPSLGWFMANYAGFGSALGSYHKVVRVALSSEGLYLATVLPFRAFHRPLLIPWRCVKSIKRKRGEAGPRYRIEIEDRAGRILLKLPATIGTELHAVRPALRARRHDVSSRAPVTGISII